MTTKPEVSAVDVELPPLRPEDHPESRSFQWSALEIKEIQRYARQAVAAALAKQAGQSEAVTHATVAGALYDIMGWLTSRRTQIVLSDKDMAGPAVDAIVDFSKMRGLCLDNANVTSWQSNLSTPQPSPVAQPVQDGFVLVPINPTPEMIEAGDGVEDLYRRGTPQTWVKVYRAMVAAAPLAQPVNAELVGADYDYQATFNAIAAAAKPNANGLGISVSAFWKTYRTQAAQPQQKEGE